MRLRKMLYWLVPASVIVMLFTGFQGLFSSGPTIEPSYACNPCDCPHDARINCQGVQFYAVYTRDTDGDDFCNIDAYRLRDDTEDGLFAFSVSETQLAGLPEFPAENLLIDYGYDIALFKLTTGELQVSAGPDPEGKVYTVVFQGCPAQNKRENSFFGGPPVVPGAETVDLDAPANNVDTAVEAPIDDVVDQAPAPSAPVTSGGGTLGDPAPTPTPPPPDLRPGIGITPG